MRKDVTTRYWAFVDRRGPDECWPWLGARRKLSGHGMFCGTHAHRMGYALAHGISVENIDACVLHRCDNPPCQNSLHLFEGTQADNLADMRAKGRYRRGDLHGTRNPRAKLTEADIAQIRKRIGAGETCASIARAFGVTDTLIGFIKRGRAWTTV